MNSHLNHCHLIPKQYAQRESLHGKMLLEAKEWSLQIQGRPIASVRMVYIHGGKNEIINTWIFPNRPKRMPVYAAELIAVGDATRVAFVDIQVPVLDGSVVEDTSMMTGLLAPQFASLPCNEAPPFWAIQESQGNFTYARNVPAVELPTIEACYLAYMDAYLNHFACDDVGESILELARDEEALNALHAYQHHHMEHSPGNKFLSKLFGSDWTEAFMHEFLFDKPQG
jgi:phycoerythrobilin:ferredoxin oxidoreductase